MFGSNSTKLNVRDATRCNLLQYYLWPGVAKWLAAASTLVTIWYIVVQTPGTAHSHPVSCLFSIPISIIPLTVVDSEIAVCGLLFASNESNSSMSPSAVTNPGGLHTGGALILAAALVFIILLPALSLTVTHSGVPMLVKLSMSSLLTRTVEAEESRTHLMQTRPCLSHSNFDQTESLRSSTSPLSSNMTVKALKKQCHELGLASTGTKSVLCERLEAFSQDQDSWDRLWLGAHKPHKGPRVCLTSKPKASHPKQSVQCHEQLLGVTVAPSTAGTSISWSKDMRTAPEIRALLPWADAITSMYPYEPTDGMPMPASAPDPPTLISNSTSGFLQPSAASDALLEEAIVQNVGMRLVEIVQGALQPSAAGSTPSVRPQVANIADMGAISTATTAYPPAVSFANDIPHLNAMWDDDTAHWLNESVITIQGHPITIKYWPLLYHYGHDQQWKGTKSKMSSNATGRAPQINSGLTLRLTVKLCDECKAEHAALVECAHQEFQAEFNNLFTYW
ncbi:hypothetical protein EDB19DRAFT_1833400 [Suillus lakei]|nr:hypothetical protein EDB19DRAFT_1833400 [Suillus lakei]